MNKICKWIVGILTLSLFLQPGSGFAATSTEKQDEIGANTQTLPKLENYSLQIKSNKNQKTINTQAFIQDGLLMVPAADLLNNTGFSLKKLPGWRGEYLAERTNFLSSTIFNQLKFTPSSTFSNLTLNEGFNGESEDQYFFLPTYPNFTHGRLYVPLKFIASMLNYDVNYNKFTHTIVLDDWGNQNAADIQQVGEFVNQYMNGALDGYSPDRSLYTPGFLEHESSRMNYTFAHDQWSNPQLTLKNWNIRHLFFVSQDRAFVKIPYEEEGEVSRTAGAIWLDLLRIDGVWKVDVSTFWSQPIYIDNIDQKIKEIEITNPEKVNAIKLGLHAYFDQANANGLSIDGDASDYKTYLKNIEVLYADDHLAYIRATYNWSFNPTEDNFENYNIYSDKDFITMERDSKGSWIYKGHLDYNLDTPITETTIRGNYNGGPSIRFTAFDDYYLDDPNIKSSVSFSE
ncbi:stalk domain-containing protein [Paenibacillus bovis]|uniref:Copper amine oxidase-like N-terminal domain-containing protein n=1 Tax=Paenibacillus bovis TaxID=1616788 RepID=A0A172ZB69_9BACL|nr:hypothetical protein [Paenibacillus bovis]ANF94743.1 hypothetical protein AR543_00975 [Paenibacillus bovis]